MIDQNWSRPLLEEKQLQWWSHKHMITIFNDDDNALLWAIDKVNCKDNSLWCTIECSNAWIDMNTHTTRSICSCNESHLNIQLKVHIWLTRMIVSAYGWLYNQHHTKDTIILLMIAIIIFECGDSTQQVGLSESK